MTSIKIYDKPLMTLSALMSAVEAGALDGTLEALHHLRREVRR